MCRIPVSRVNPTRQRLSNALSCSSEVCPGNAGRRFRPAQPARIDGGRLRSRSYEHDVGAILRDHVSRCCLKSLCPPALVLGHAGLRDKDGDHLSVAHAGVRQGGLRPGEFCVAKERLRLEVSEGMTERLDDPETVVDQTPRLVDAKYRASTIDLLGPR